MFTPRYTIAMLFAATTALGLACGALANANSWWWSLVYTVSFLSVIVSCVTAIFAKGPTRAFAGGVVLTTVIYAYHFVAPALLSDQLLSWVQDYAWSPAQRGDSDYKSHFSMIWYTLWGGPFTLFGGIAARLVYLRREPGLSSNDRGRAANPS
jgi:hypothetical protein